MADGGLKLPSGTYAITGATSALPNEIAIRSQSNLTRRLCFPSAIAGPFCSVPPIGMMMVVLPVPISSRNSVHVRSSRKIEGRSSEYANGAKLRIRNGRSKRHAARTDRMHFIRSFLH
jgi:hypothetical protein